MHRGELHMFSNYVSVFLIFFQVSLSSSHSSRHFHSYDSYTDDDPAMKKNEKMPFKDLRGEKCGKTTHSNSQCVVWWWKNKEHQVMSKLFCSLSVEFESHHAQNSLSHSFPTYDNDCWEKSFHLSLMSLFNRLLSIHYMIVGVQ